VTDALLEYTPNLEVLSLGWHDTHIMHGIDKLKHLKEQRLADCSADFLELVPPTVEHLHLSCIDELTDAALAQLKHLCRSLGKDRRGDASHINGEFLSELSLLKKLTLYQTSLADVYHAALQRFVNDNEALAALGKSTLAEPSGTILLRFGTLGGWQVLLSAIRLHRADLGTILALCRPTGYAAALPYVVEAFCFKLGIAPYVASDDVLDARTVPMPLIWEALKREDAGLNRNARRCS
jgi:hypothetical protein